MSGDSPPGVAPHQAPLPVITHRTGAFTWTEAATAKETTILTTPTYQFIKTKIVGMMVFAQKSQFTQQAHQTPAQCYLLRAWQIRLVPTVTALLIFMRGVEQDVQGLHQFMRSMEITQMF